MLAQSLRSRTTPTLAGGLSASFRSLCSGSNNVLPERMPLLNARRCVIKVGTAVVSNPDGTLALSRMGALVEQLLGLKKQGRQVLLVSSGAVGLGRQRLGLAKDVVANTANVIDRQACAATGQGVLMSTYDMMMQRMGITCAQVLITQGDFLSRTRYTNLTETLERLAALSVVPIINENDVVTGCNQLDVQQVFSDNDKLSALVAAGADADGLALLTDVDAVFTKPPDQPGAERIKVWTRDRQVQIGEKSTMGRGGMASKIGAATVAAAGGVHTVVASGFDVTNIEKIFNGADVGTLFTAEERPNKRKRWLTFATETKGRITVKDDGIQRLLRLGSGPKNNIFGADITDVKGLFEEKDVVSIVSTTGQEVARGMVQVDSKTLEGLLVDPSLGSSHPTFQATLTVISGQEVVILENSVIR